MSIQLHGNTAATLLLKGYSSSGSQGSYLPLYLQGPNCNMQWLFPGT